MLYARVGDELYVHGSPASRAVRTLAAGTPTCVTVTLVEGLVLARSAYEHPANYRSAMLLGTFRLIEDEADRLTAFEAFTDKLVPGRWSEVRGPNQGELKASAILALPIAEAAVKIRTGPPSDDDSPDAALHTRADVVPLITGFGTPEPAPRLEDRIPLAVSVRRLLERKL